MIFQQDLAELIIAGRKTVTRRPVNDENPRSPWWKEQTTYKVGQEFTINPGRGVYRLGTAEITTPPWQEELGDISEYQANLEGCSSRSDFFDLIKRIHGKLDREEQVWVLPFRLTSVTNSALVDEQLDLGGARLVILAPSFLTCREIADNWRANRDDRSLRDVHYCASPSGTQGLLITPETRVIQVGPDHMIRDYFDKVRVLQHSAAKIRQPLQIVRVTEDDR